jgi:hypothetical protein
VPHEDGDAHTIIREHKWHTAMAHAVYDLPFFGAKNGPSIVGLMRSRSST